MLKLFDLIPNWVLAAALALALLGYGYQSSVASGAQRRAAEAREQLTGERLRHEKALGEQTAIVLQKTNELNAAHAALESANEDRRRTSAEVQRRLAAAALAGRLRDPNAAACGGAAASATAAPAGSGAEGGAEAGGLFSAAATRLLQRITREADEINDAYAACRPDALSIREKLGAEPKAP